MPELSPAAYIEIVKAFSVEIHVLNNYLTAYMPGVRVGQSRPHQAPAPLDNKIHSSFIFRYVVTSQQPIVIQNGKIEYM